MASKINSKKPIDIKKTFPKNKEEKNGKKKIINHEKILFLPIIKLRNEYKSKG